MVIQFEVLPTEPSEMQVVFANAISKTLKRLARHRERYVRAWIAATGIDPRDAMLVECVRPDGTVTVTIEPRGHEERVQRAKVGIVDAQLAERKALSRCLMDDECQCGAAKVAVGDAWRAYEAVVKREVG